LSYFLIEKKFFIFYKSEPTKSAKESIGMERLWSDTQVSEQKTEERMGTSYETISFQQQCSIRSATKMDTDQSIRLIALQEAKRRLFEDVGRSLYKQITAFIPGVTGEQIAAFASGIIPIKVFNEKWDRGSFYIGIGIESTPERIVDDIVYIFKSDSKGKELERSRKRAKDLLNEIEKLRDELAQKEDHQKAGSLEKAINELHAVEWFEQGKVLYWYSSNSLCEKAADAFTKAIELSPYYADAYCGRGISYCVLDRLGPCYCKNSSKSLSDLDKAVELEPYNDYFCFRRGLHYKHNNNEIMAMKDFDKSIELNQHNMWAYFHRGDLYYKIGNYNKALKDYDRAVEIDPRNVAAHNKLGLAYSQLEDHTKAIREFSLSIELDPQNKKLYYNRGIEYNNLGNYEEAIRDFKRALDIDPNFKEAETLLKRTYAGERIK
jgi:tetratricopeptide (TPR) repeat protein